MFTDDDLPSLAARGIGVLIGVLASLIMIAPEGTKNNAYRVLVSVTMGFIFAPVVSDLPGLGFLAGGGSDHALARGAASGFAIWSVLQVLARLLSNQGGWIERMLKEMARIRGGGRE